MSSSTSDFRTGPRDLALYPPSEKSPYFLPFAGGTARWCTQGNHGWWSHSGWQCYAYDFAMPVTEPIERQFIARHRLVKKDPKALISEPVAPIVYYVDPGAPEPVPVRQAV